MTMPITLKIGHKAPRFDGDRPTSNATVSGPAELFTKELEKMLFLHGLNGVSSGDYIVWSSRYMTAPPPSYLGPLLAAKHDVSMARDLRMIVNEAVSTYSSQFSLGTSAGEEPLRVDFGAGVFIANCSGENYARRSFLEGAGWRPLISPPEGVIARFGDRPYVAKDPILATCLEPYMGLRARSSLSELFTRAGANIRKSARLEAPETFSIPAPEGKSYLDFQKVSAQAVTESGRNALIGDDMGLGKTIQAIGILNGTPKAQKILVTCKANMRLKWVSEIDSWKVNKDLTAGHAEGDNWPDTDVVVINYDILGRHLDRIHGQDWDLVFVDEAQDVTNPDAQRTRALLGDIAGTPDDADPMRMVPIAQGGQLVMLTGTPKPNKISGLFPLLSATDPETWGRGKDAFWAFIQRYQPPFYIEKTIKRGSHSFKKILAMPGKPVRELELNLRMKWRGTMFRRKKTHIADLLPPKMRSAIPMPIRMTRELVAQLKETEADFTAAARRALTAQGISPQDPRLATDVIDVFFGKAMEGIDFSEGARVRANLGRLKAPYCARFIIDELKSDNELDPEDRPKTVVFAHHKEVIGIIADKAKKELGEDAVLVYDGSVTSAKKRQALVDRFQGDKKARLFIMSLSGASGITLTAAYRMRIVEPDWNPSSMAQIEDRIWRIGQEMPVNIGYLFIPDSFDINVGMKLVEKMETDVRAIDTPSMRGMKSMVAKRAEIDRKKLSGADFESETAQAAFSF